MTTQENINGKYTMVNGVKDYIHDYNNPQNDHYVNKTPYSIGRPPREGDYYYEFEFEPGDPLQEWGYIGAGSKVISSRCHQIGKKYFPSQ